MFDLYRVPNDHWVARSLSGCARAASCGCAFPLLLLPFLLMWAVARLT